MAGIRHSYFLVVLQNQIMSEHAFHPLGNHSRIVQFSGLLPTDPAPQELELLWRALELGSTFGQLQGAELSCFELLARRVRLLEMKFRDKVAGIPFGCSFEEDSNLYLGTGQTRGLLMIASELEEFASGLLAKETAAAQESRRAARWRPEEMTVPGEERVAVLVTKAVQKVARPVSRELLPLPIPFPKTRW